MYRIGWNVIKLYKDFSRLPKTDPYRVPVRILVVKWHLKVLKIDCFHLDLYFCHRAIVLPFKALFYNPLIEVIPFCEENILKHYRN